MSRSQAVALVLVLLVVFPASVFASDFPVLEKQVETRKAHLEWVSAICEESMQAIIDYLDGISSDGGTERLSSLLGEFRDKASEAETLTTHIALNNHVRQLVNITADFRLEARKLMEENDGRILELLSQIAAQLEEHKEDLNILKDRYWETRRRNVLEIMDICVGRAQDVLETLEDRGYNITDAQARLEEIKLKRSDLEDALDARNSVRVVRVELEILGLSVELGEIVEDLQVEIPKEKIVEYWITVCGKALERIDTIISELKALGLDVTELEEAHSKAETDLERTEEAFESGDLLGAIGALNDLKSDLIELKEAYEELMEDLSGDMREKVESLIEALRDALEGMDESV